MLCQTCRRSLLAQVRGLHKRGIANAAPSQPPPSATQSRTPTVSSTIPNASQPSSTSSSPSILTENVASAGGKKELKRTKLQSSISGGTELKGIAYLKATPQIMAKEDDEYPEWLWTLLEEPKSASGAPAVDLAAMTKKQRGKYERKQERLMKNIPKPIPIHEQSRDLTGPNDNAIVSLQKRQEITQSSREARRKGIRESNFLKAM